MAMISSQFIQLILYSKLPTTQILTLNDICASGFCRLTLSAFKRLARICTRYKITTSITRDPSQFERSNKKTTYGYRLSHITSWVLRTIKEYISLVEAPIRETNYRQNIKILLSLTPADCFESFFKYCGWEAVGCLEMAQYGVLYFSNSQ